MWMILKYVRYVCTFILDILSPRQCYICKTNNASICKKCISQFKPSVDSPYPYIHCLYSFKDPQVKKIIHAIKYFHRKDLILPLALSLADEIKKLDNYTDYALAPIPMPSFRKYTRGFNHTEALACAISKVTSLPVITDLHIKNSSRLERRQVSTRSRSERLRNRHDAFIIETPLQHKKLLIIDDVTTTGATLNEARKVLLLSGATHVLGYTIAH